jgi:hypothetical protein
MKNIAKALGLKEDATEAEIAARIAENSALTLNLVSEKEALENKVKDDEEEAKNGETKPAKSKKDDDDDDDKPVTKAMHNKLKDMHDKLKDRVKDCEDRLKDCEGKMKAKAKSEDDDKAKNMVENLVKTGRIADNEATKNVVLKNLTKDFEGFSEVYNSLPTPKKEGVKNVNSIINLAAEAKETEKPSAFKKSAIRAAMDEALENEKKTESSIK